MRTSRVLTAGAVALTGALALSACGSDSNTGGASGSGGAAATGGWSAAAAACFSGTLNGEGSSAQKNAIEEAIKAYQNACSDATINYNPTGSGAGIKQFIAEQVDFAGSDSALKTDEGRRREPTTQPPAAPTPGTCRWWPARSRSPTTSRASTSLVLDADVAGQDLQRRRSPPGTTRPSPR